MAGRLAPAIGAVPLQHRPRIGGAAAHRTGCRARHSSMPAGTGAPDQIRSRQTRPCVARHRGGDAVDAQLAREQRRQVLQQVDQGETVGVHPVRQRRPARSRRAGPRRPCGGASRANRSAVPISAIGQDWPPSSSRAAARATFCSLSRDALLHQHALEGAALLGGQLGHVGQRLHRRAQAGEQAATGARCRCAAGGRAGRRGRGRRWRPTGVST